MTQEVGLKAAEIPAGCTLQLAFASGASKLERNLVGKGLGEAARGKAQASHSFLRQKRIAKFGALRTKKIAGAALKRKSLKVAGAAAAIGGAAYLANKIRNKFAKKQ